MRLINADALKSELSDKDYITYTHEYGEAIPVEWVMSAIDNAQTVVAENATSDRPQGEWYEYIDKGLLKARNGDYVLYKVDYLLDNLAREVNIMESARRMKCGVDMRIKSELNDELNELGGRG